MGTCFGHPFGVIKGKVGKLVFSYRRGVQIVSLRRENNIPQNITSKNNSNIMILLARMYYLLNPEFHKYWNSLKKNLPGHICFISQNLGFLCPSIPNRKQPLGENNWIDISQLQLVYNGKLYEPKMKIENPTYNSNELNLKWNTRTFRDGKSDDVAHIVAVYCSPLNKGGTVYNHLYDCQPDTPPVILNSLLSNGSYELKVFYGKSVRENGEATIQINENLNPKFLTVFLFFSNATTYSDISGAKLLGL
ncbi:MAG: hypothetical protein PHE49_06795 [bacterium]|nr:hypothetical protein [bacterium]